MASFDDDVVDDWESLVDAPIRVPSAATPVAVAAPTPAPAAAAAPADEPLELMYSTVFDEWTTELLRMGAETRRSLIPADIADYIAKYMAAHNHRRGGGRNRRFFHEKKDDLTLPLADRSYQEDQDMAKKYLDSYGIRYYDTRLTEKQKMRYAQRIAADFKTYALDGVGLIQENLARTNFENFAAKWILEHFW
jgi:hypothetical protein